MNIVFHGKNALNFRNGFEDLLEGRYTVFEVQDRMVLPGEAECYAQADIIIGNRLEKGMPVPGQLKLYQVPGAGYDRIDRGALPSGAVLCNCFGHERAIAEYVFAALLARHVPLADADSRLRKGDWKYWAGASTSERTEVGSKSIGILGFGHIGKALADLANALAMKVAVANRTPLETNDRFDFFPLGDLEHFMGSSDIIVNTLPLTDETRGLVGAAALGAMRRDALLVNVGRGAVVDQQALYSALRDRRLGGAVIDTWYGYPSPADPTPLPADLPFHELDNVVMTPHMSGWTRETIERRKRAMAKNVERVASRRAPVNIVHEPTG